MHSGLRNEELIYKCSGSRLPRQRGTGMFPFEEEITIGEHTYLLDSEKGSIRRFNNKTKMWINFTFGDGSSEEELLKKLSNEYIRQQLEK